MLYAMTADEMRAMDAETIEIIGIPGAVLMENAGRRVVDIVLDELESCGDDPRVAVVCGAGNNGGDGYVIARVLRETGVNAAVFSAARRGKLSGDAKLHFDAYEACDGVVIDIADEAGLSSHREAIETAEVVVDAVFGTGLTRNVEGHYRAVIETINAAAGRIVAVDIPSGLSSDTGRVLGVVARADHTVTMAFLKVGMAISPGYARCGDVSVAEIGIPSRLGASRSIRLAMLEDSDMAPLVPVVDELDHKSVRGHVLVVAGSPGKRGAARLTAMAALRSGAGLATIATLAAGELQIPDPVMTAELDADDARAGAVLQELAVGKRAVAMGPGMATGEGGKKLVLAALTMLDLPLILDADALNHLVGELPEVAASSASVILTPHPGEAARLLGTTTAKVERDRVAAVRALADATGKAVVLKGPRTLICHGGSGDGFTAINPTGNPGLATAGSGDVLTGVIAALAAQGLGSADAARLGVYCHGHAGDRVCVRVGVHGVVASDVIDELSPALREIAGAGEPAL